jgi:hypothetical protein
MLLGCDLNVPNDTYSKWAIAVGWAAIFIACGYLGFGTVGTLRRVGLFGARPPLSMLNAVWHIVIAIRAVALLFVFRGALERVALLIAASASSSTALYGFGLRSSTLSGFRLLSHFAAYALIMIVALRRIAGEYNNWKPTH